MRWPKYWSFSFSISPSNEHPGLISFRMDWLNLLAGQGTLKSLLQHHSSKASILWHSAFLYSSNPYMTTGKTIALTRRTFVGKVTSLLFHMLSRFIHSRVHMSISISPFNHPSLPLIVTMFVLYIYVSISLLQIISPLISDIIQYCFSLSDLLFST